MSTASAEKPIQKADQRWLTPGVRGIGAASLLADAGHEIPTSLLPTFLTSTLGAPASALGLIEGISDGLAGAARFGGGALADDPHRRRATAIGGYASTAVLSALIGAASSAWQVGVLRAGAWASRGLRVPARNALLADTVPASVYGRAYGFERAMDNLGAIVGPLLALALVGLFGVAHGDPALGDPRAARGGCDRLRDPAHRTTAGARARADPDQTQARPAR